MHSISIQQRWARRSFKRRDDDELKFAITLSPAGKSQFLAVLSGTKYLEKAKTYESKEGRRPWERNTSLWRRLPAVREAEPFNYSDLKDVNALVTFFEALILQETIAIDLGRALQFDRLGIPERLDQLEGVLKQGRIADPKNMVEMLGMIERDEHIVNYARAHARELSEKITSGK